MFSARLVQVFVTLLVGALIFFWVRRAAANDLAAVLSLALWMFNPNVLAYGHLITTDVDGTLGIVAAVLLFAMYLESPNNRKAAFAGAALGFALTMKFNALTLGPIFAALAVVSWRTLKAAGKHVWKHALILAAAAWAVILLAYCPMWAPAPAISERQAEILGIPGWFSSLRPVLIPRDFFKGVALVISHSKIGHEAYLMGEWSHTGWRSYFPIAYFLKSPLAFVVVTIAGLAITVKQLRSLPLLATAPWIAAAVYFALAIASNVNIGVRHLLPVFALVCIGAGCAYARVQKPWARRALLGLGAWQAALAIAVYPLYLQFMSEAIGGSANGYKYLIDSNYDWGQDANRLKKFLDERGIPHIYLDYFGTQYNIEYLKIPNTRVTAEQAGQLRDGWLVVSASELMRDEWKWLRESRVPAARVADTLFVYHLGN
jgi:dolichyl-phosphate-mannose-protein mannosyltransferase